MQYQKIYIIEGNSHYLLFVSVHYSVGFLNAFLKDFLPLKGVRSLVHLLLVRFTAYTGEIKSSP